MQRLNGIWLKEDGVSSIHQGAGYLDRHDEQPQGACMRTRERSCLIFSASLTDRMQRLNGIWLKEDGVSSIHQGAGYLDRVSAAFEQEHVRRVAPGQLLLLSSDESVNEISALAHGDEDDINRLFRKLALSLLERIGDVNGREKQRSTHGQSQAGPVFKVPIDYQCAILVFRTPPAV